MGERAGTTGGEGQPKQRSISREGVEGAKRDRAKKGKRVEREGGREKRMIATVGKREWVRGKRHVE